MSQFRTRFANSEIEQKPPGRELVRTHTAHDGGHASLLAMWHLLSLDAPTVAAVWTVFIARCAGLTLSWETPAAMFAAVWVLYAADRLLDASPFANSSQTVELEARHRFHHLHRKRFLISIVVAAMLLATLLPSMNAKALHLYCILAALLAVWLLMVHMLPAHGSYAHRLPKELAVGVCFPAAVFIPTVARTVSPVRALLPSALFLGAVCTLNCLFIYTWEHSDLSNASQTTGWAVKHLTWLTAAVMVPAIVAARIGHGTLRPIALACSLSAATLWLLHSQRLKTSSLNLRSAADLTLLTPMLLFSVLKFLQ